MGSDRGFAGIDHCQFDISPAVCGRNCRFGLAVARFGILEQREDALGAACRPVGNGFVLFRVVLQLCLQKQKALVSRGF